MIMQSTCGQRTRVYSTFAKDGTAIQIVLHVRLLLVALHRSFRVEAYNSLSYVSQLRHRGSTHEQKLSLRNAWCSLVSLVRL